MKQERQPRVPGRVSAIIIAYRHAAFIEEATRSVAEQDYPDLEIIVADDGSNDGSAEKIARMAKNDSRIIPVLLSENRGNSANWNAGTARASGEFVALMAGDDLMLPGKLPKQIEYLRRHPECGLCTHDMEVFDSQTGKALYSTQDRFGAHGGGIETLFPTNWFFGRETKSIPSSTVARSDFMLSHRLDERLRYRNEWLHMIDCMATTGLGWGHLPEVLGRYRMHEGQAHTSTAAAESSFEEAMIVLAVAASRYPRLSKLVKNKRDFMRFQHLVFDWHKPEKRKAFETQFRREAGWVKWFYMKAIRFYLHNGILFGVTAPARHFFKKFFTGKASGIVT